MLECRNGFVRVLPPVADKRRWPKVAPVDIIENGLPFQMAAHETEHPHIDLHIRGPRSILAIVLPDGLPTLGQIGRAVEAQQPKQYGFPFPSYRWTCGRGPVTILDSGTCKHIQLGGGTVILELEGESIRGVWQLHEDTIQGVGDDTATSA
jgi:hypothetical protein